MRDVDGQWRERILAWAREQAVTDGAILDVRVAGSLVNPQDTDEWSDVDLLLVVSPEALDRISDPTWVAAIGKVWAWDASGGGERRTVRYVFEDGRWLDLVVATSTESLALTSRSLIRHDVVTIESLPAGKPLLHELDNGFRFASALAVTKIARNDLVIGIHLALGLLRDCLVLAMLIRDRDGGAHHHRVGGPLNEVAFAVCSSHATVSTAQDALTLIDHAASLWTTLASRRDASYLEDRRGLTALLDQARQSIGGQGPLEG